MEEKMCDYQNSGATSHSRFIPFASEKVRGETHLDETMEFQYSLYKQPGNWSEPGRQLVNASELFHKVCVR